MHRAFSGADKVAVKAMQNSNGADLCQPLSVLIDCVAGKVYPVVPVHAGAALIKPYVPVQPLGIFQAVIVRECVHIVVQIIKNSCAILKNNIKHKIFPCPHRFYSWNHTRPPRWEFKKPPAKIIQ